MVESLLDLQFGKSCDKFFQWRQDELRMLRWWEPEAG
jgi:hypothetical protein